MMKDFLKNNNININGIEKMSHPEAKYSSFKISISVTDKQKVLDSSFWPNGIQRKMCQLLGISDNQNIYSEYVNNNNGWILKRLWI